MTVPMAAAEGRRSVHWATLLIWLALTIAIVVAARRLPWDRTLSLLMSVNTAWVAAAIAAHLLILPLWALEWKILAPASARVPFTRMWDVVTISAAVLNTIPFLAGEASAVAMLIERAGLTRGAAASVLAMDQLLVAFAKLIVIASAAVAAPLPGWLQAGVASLGVAFALLLVTLMLLAHFWADVRERLLRASGRARHVAARVVAWGVHLEPLRDPRRALAVTGLAIAKKVAELAAIIAVQVAFGLNPSVASALLVLAALAITTLLPIAPANLGIYEGTVYGTYRVLGVTPEIALGLAIVQHFCFLLPPIVIGYGMLTWRELSPRSRAT
jgi:uncharacterized membrane protein YbhN (UPF0104 family)